MSLTESNVDAIRQVIEQSKISFSSMKDDILDHLCCAVEYRMRNGQNFEVAFAESLHEFSPNGLHEIEEETHLLLSPEILSMKRLIYGFRLISFFCIAMIAMLVVGLVLGHFVSHNDSALVSAQVAEAEFMRLRARFSDQKPLLDMRCREPLAGPYASRAVAPLHSVHTVIFDTRGKQRIVRITVPYWFLRYFPGRSGEFRWLGELTFFDDTEFDPEAIRLSLEQLDQHGPGLITYYRHASGGQFISWVE